MSTETKPIALDAVVDLGIADEFVAGLRGRLEGAKADTPKGYEIVRKGIGECRIMRRHAKESHKELKDSALRWGQACDKELRRVVALIKEVEGPLQDEKDRIDDEKARKKLEREEAAQRKREADEAEAKALREAAEKIQRDRIRKEQEAEQKRLDDDRREIEKRKSELQAERDKIDAEKASLDKAKADQEAAERAAAAKVESQRQADEEKKRDEETRAFEAKRKAEQEAEAKRLRDERRPDCETLFILAETLDKYEMPRVKTEWAEHVLSDVRFQLHDIATHIGEAIDKQ